jgi:cobyric acid synthase
VAAVTTRGTRFGAYEIHLGVTTLTSSADLTPFAQLEDGTSDGVRCEGVIGTYLHGALESPAVCAEIFGIDMPAVASKANHYARLADWFQEHVRHAAALALDVSRSDSSR